MVKTENLNSLVSLPGCQEPFRQDRITNRGVAVAVYVRDGLAASAINSVTSPLFQFLVLSIVLSQRKRLTLIVCYLPPGNNIRKFTEILNQDLTDIPANASRNLCLVGDLNSKN